MERTKNQQKDNAFVSFAFFTGLPQGRLFIIILSKPKTWGSVRFQKASKTPLRAVVSKRLTLIVPWSSTAFQMLMLASC